MTNEQALAAAEKEHAKAQTAANRALAKATDAYARNAAAHDHLEACTLALGEARTRVDTVLARAGSGSVTEITEEVEPAVVEPEPREFSGTAADTGPRLVDLELGDDAVG